MRTVFIIHGAYGNSHENWIPWLKKELEALGNKVITPDFPTPQGQSLTAWMNIFSTYKQDIDENTVFVDHSLGCAFILSVLEEDREKPVRACYLVSGFAGPLGDARFDAINKTFTIKKFDWEKIKGNCFIPTMTRMCRWRNAMNWQKNSKGNK